MPIRLKMIIMLLLGAGAASWVSSMYYGKQRAQDSRDVAEFVAKVQTERADHSDALLSAQARIGKIDAEYTAELAKAKKSNEDLRACVDSGKCGLRVAATCDASPAGATSKTGSARVDHGTAPRLTPTAQRAYYTLSDELDKQRKQLEAAQKVLAECQR